jgi:hypothetical protein
MIVSIMQPYLLPYIGYFQLIASSNLFIAYDDVQYIKGGWINRNRILVNGSPAWITLPVVKAGHRLAIKQRQYIEIENGTSRMLRRIEASYRAAPLFQEVFPLLREVITHKSANVAQFNVHVLRHLAARMGIRTPIVLSSMLDKDERLSGQDRIMDICLRVGATRYVNSIGGVGKYNAQNFARSNIELSFLRSTVKPYPQFGQATIPSLSIVDVLMFNDDAAIAQMLSEFELI